MKSVTVIGEIIAFLFLIILGYFLSLGMIYMHNVSKVVGGPNYTLEVEAAAIPVKHEYALMSFLETTYTTSSNKNIPVKKIMTAAVNQHHTINQYNMNAWVDGEYIDLEDLSENILNNWKGDAIYLLKLKTPSKELKLVWDINKLKAKKILNIQKIRTQIISPFGNGELELYVSD